jgi:rhodanese-related sulfurtransferase
MSVERINLIKAAWQVPVIAAIAAVIALSVNFLRSDGIPLLADWSTEARLKAPSGEGLSIPLEEAVSLFESNKAVFIDARSEEDFHRGHIQGAHSLPWQQVEQKMTEVLPMIPPDAVVITYCDGDTCNLSKDLALFLMDMGFEHVKVLVNGWTVWQENRLPVDKGN